MHKVSRSLLLAGVLAFGTLTAACGDTVELTQTTPTSGITSITVTPQNPTLTLVATGTQPSLTFVATVVATGGASTTVAWSSSNTAVADVNATSGVAIAKAVGTTSIIATIGTGATAVSSASTLTVLPANGSTSGPATVTIQSVTQNGLLFPVQLNNVAGQIDVTMNVETGTQKVDSLQLTVDGQVVASQRLQASAAAIATEGSVPGASNALVPVDITLSFNTAIFDTLGVCPVAGWTTCFGGARFTNGVKQLGTRIFVNGVTATPGASNSIGITFNNIDGFYATQTALNSIASRSQPNSASDAAGRLWFQAGSGIRVRSVPVIYSGRTIASRTLSFATVGAGTATITANAANGNTTGGVRIDTIPLGAIADTGIVTVSNALATDGNAITLVGNGGNGVINAQVLALGNTSLLANATIGQRLIPTRIDNQAPATPAFVLSGSKGGVYNWINAPYTLASGVTVGADNGVGLVNGANAAAASTFAAGGAPTALANVSIVAGLASAATSTWTALPAANSTIGAAAQATPAVVSPSDVNLFYSAQVMTADLLGNASSQLLTVNAANPVNVVVGAVTRATFGVDTLAPLVRYADAATGTAPAQAGILARTVDSVRVLDDRVFAIDYIDDRAGFVGSGAPGVPAGNPQLTSVLRLSNAVATPRTGPGVLSCAIGTFVTASGTCTPAATAYGPTVLSDNWVRSAAVSIDGNQLGDVVGYYSFAASVKDMAGNSSATIAKRSAVDPAAPAITGFAVPSTISGGGSALFIPTGDDDLEVTAGQLTLNYTLMSLVYPFAGYTDFNSSVGATKWDGTLSTPVQAPLTVNNVIDQIETVDGADAPVNTAAGSRPTTATADLRDVFGTTTPVPFNQVILNSAWTQAPASWTSIGGTGAIVKWHGLTGTRTAITFELVGPTGQSVLPFGTVQVWMRVGAGPNYTKIEGTYSTTGVDNGTNRIWTVVFTPTTQLAAATPYNVRALGIGHAAGAATLMDGNALATNVLPFTTP